MKTVLKLFLLKHTERILLSTFIVSGQYYIKVTIGELTEYNMIPYIKLWLAYKLNKIYKELGFLVITSGNEF